MTGVEPREVDWRITLGVESRVDGGGGGGGGGGRETDDSILLSLSLYVCIIYGYGLRVVFFQKEKTLLRGLPPFLSF